MEHVADPHRLQPAALRARPVRRRPSDSRPDAALIARVRAGDDAAFEELYDRYHRRLLAFCQHMLRSHEEAEDVVQHTFLAAYRWLREGFDVADVKPWLYTIARNRCVSVVRGRREEIALDESAPASEGLAAEVDRRADLRLLVRDVQRLPPDQRAALVLFEVGDHSHQEIATVLGVRREKVKALVFQAREALMGWRTARETPCAHVREQLATLTGSALGRRAIRRHVEQCAGCADFEAAVRCQRAALAIALPVVPAAGLRAAVLGSAIGGAATTTAAGGLAGLGVNAVAAKILVVTALVGGAGAARVAVGEPAPHRAAAASPHARPATLVRRAQPARAGGRAASAPAPVRRAAASAAPKRVGTKTKTPHVAAQAANAKAADDAAAAGAMANADAAAPARLKAPGTPARGKALNAGRANGKEHGAKTALVRTARRTTKPKPPRAASVNGAAATKAPGTAAPAAQAAPGQAAAGPPGQAAAGPPGQSAAGPPGRLKKQGDPAAETP